MIGVPRATDGKTPEMPRRPAPAGTIWGSGAATLVPIAAGRDGMSASRRPEASTRPALLLPKLAVSVLNCVEKRDRPARNRSALSVSRAPWAARYVETNPAEL